MLLEPKFGQNCSCDMWPCVLLGNRTDMLFPPSLVLSRQGGKFFQSILEMNSIRGFYSNSKIVFSRQLGNLPFARGDRESTITDGLKQGTRGAWKITIICSYSVGGVEIVFNFVFRDKAVLESHIDVVLAPSVKRMWLSLERRSRKYKHQAFVRTK